MLLVNFSQLEKQGEKKIGLAKFEEVGRQTRASSNKSNSKKRKAEEEPEAVPPKKLPKTNNLKKNAKGQAKLLEEVELVNIVVYCSCNTH
jgi:hypothetical protein